jgi:GNAT superfamily N-acetyltransferase
MLAICRRLPSGTPGIVTQRRPASRHRAAYDHHMPLELRRCDAAEPPASDLTAATLAEFDVIAGRRLTGGILTPPSDFEPPHGAYLVGFHDGVPVCGGGVRTLREGIAEVKRMYVVPDFRRRGFARELLAGLEQAARDMGHELIRLDSTAATWAIYSSAGYRQIADYNSNPHADFWGEKDL